MILVFDKSTNLLKLAFNPTSVNLSADFYNGGKSTIQVSVDAFQIDSVKVDDTIIIPPSDLENTPFESTGFGGYIESVSKSKENITISFVDFYSYIISLPLTTGVSQPSGSVEDQLDLELSSLANIYLPSIFSVRITDHETEGLALARENDEVYTFQDLLNSVLSIYKEYIKVSISLSPTSYSVILTNEFPSTININAQEDFVKNFSIDFSSNQEATSLIFFPKKENTIKTSAEWYFLGSDGVIYEGVNNKSHRQFPLKLAVEYFDDYQTFGGESPNLTKAKETFAESTLNHQISMTLDNNNFLRFSDLKPFTLANIYLRDGNIVESILTSISFPKDTSQMNLMFGYYRSSLTGKLKKIISKGER